MPSRIDSLGERSKILVSSLSMMTSNIVVAVLSVAAIHLSAQRLGGEGFGHFATVISIVTMVGLLADLGITSLTTRDVAAQPDKARQIIGEALAFRMCLCAVLAPVLITAAYYLYPKERASVVVGVALMTIDLFCLSVQAIVQAYFSAQVRNDITSLLLLLAKVIYFAGTVVGVLFTSDVVYYIGAYVFADVVSSALSLRLVRRRIGVKPIFLPRSWWRTFRSAASLGAMQVVNRLYSRLDSFLLSILRPAVDVATYGIAFNFADVLGNLPGYLMASVLPSMVRAQTKEELASRLQSAWNTVIWLAAPIAIGGFVLRHQIVLLVAGPGYGAATTPLGILVISLAVSFPQVVFVWGCLAVRRYSLLFPAIVVVTVANVTMNLLLIPPYGPNGAAVSQLTTQALSLVLTFAIFRRQSGLRIRLQQPWKAVVVAAALLPIASVTKGAWATGSEILNPLLGAVILGGIYLVGTICARSAPIDAREVLDGFKKIRAARKSNGTDSDDTVSLDKLAPETETAPEDEMSSTNRRPGG
jgi:O-antigen/teichoic acid export membrane protein